ncbi:MAG: respiratory nitrate reductase subunit gamma [Crocinitomix sp.]|nr:respiratory nitrate reductase subunit gamma [Crocinitomix sp.]
MEGHSIIKKKKIMLWSKNSATKYRAMLGTLAIFLSTFLLSSNLLAQEGGELFKNRCSVCHSVSDDVIIGPGLGGITEKRTEEWLATWIKDSDAMIKSGDPDAIAIYEEFNKSAMPAFTDLSDDEIQGLVEYMADPTVVAAGGDESVASGSDATVATGPDYSAFLLWGLIILMFVIAYFYNYLRKVKKLSREDGIFFGPHQIKNFPLIFFIILAVFSLVIILLIEGLNNNISHINGLLFATLPYVAFGLFIVGSIYRYTKKGYKVSSLSTQFLEGKKLFWGSQPFHWGLMVIFFGHLIAFMFPRALIAWNGQPVRLLILEISSFAFALLALLGLILLIKRRLTSKTLLVVTNKMDMVVYAILLTQIVSGLGVAYFVRWGSSWFASVLTPYLRSIFSFSPDIDAVSAAPVWVQIHIVAAFVLIGLIPFTRFMHFLVAPVDYLWRRYQMVIWNWNKSKIRQSKSHFFGKKPRNH